MEKGHLCPMVRRHPCDIAKRHPCDKAKRQQCDIQVMTLPIIWCSWLACDVLGWRMWHTGDDAAEHGGGGANTLARPHLLQEAPGISIDRSIYLSISVYICLYIYTCICRYLHIRIHVYMYIYVCMYVCMHACMYTIYVQIYTRTDVHTYICRSFAKTWTVSRTLNPNPKP